MKSPGFITAALLLAISLAAAASPKVDSDNQAMVRKAAGELAKQGRFQKIDLAAEDGIVTLTGEVNLYVDKLDAEKRVRKTAGVEGVRNRLEVAPANLNDAQLRETLADKLRYDRAGYGIMFNSLALEVVNGNVTVSGNVRDYPDRDSALAIIETTPGVQSVTDAISVAPVSPYDDHLRLTLARAIYGHPALMKYAIDPQAPIRIVVEHGSVELHGAVLNEMDRQLAGAQANAVPGVFSLNNRLVVVRE